MITLLWLPAAQIWRAFFGSDPATATLIDLDGEWSWRDLSQAEDTCRRLGLKIRRDGEGSARVYARIPGPPISNDSPAA